MQLFTHAPQQQGRVETLTWRTAISVSRTGVELRESTRPHPRLSITGTYYLDSLPEFARNAEPILVALHYMPATLVATPQGDRYGFPHAPAPFSWCISTTLDGRKEANAPDPVTGLFPEAGYSSCVAAIPCHLATDLSSDLIVRSLHRVQLTFESAEPFTAYTPTPPSAAAPGSPIAAPKGLAHNFDIALKEMHQRAMQRFDAGFVREQELRYKKRVLTLKVSLFGESAIHEFRRFVCALQGAAGAFRWTPLGEAEGVWRLGSDSVSITHITRSVAECTLTIVELE